MLTLAEQIVDRLGRATAPQDDDQLAAQFNVARQAVNQACRRLAVQGVIVREVGAAGKLVNRLIGVTAPAPPVVITKTGGDGLLAEDEVKRALEEHLASVGFEVIVAWGRVRGIDIDARRGDERIILEAKGEVALAPQQVNYFLGALGELLQRMSDPTAVYGLALPDNRQYRGLVDRLPALVRERLNLSVYFVARDGVGYRVEVI